jgi:hypothetical protein
MERDSLDEVDDIKTAAVDMVVAAALPQLVHKFRLAQKKAEAEEDTCVRFPDKHGQRMGANGVLEDESGGKFASLASLKAQLRGSGQAPKVWLSLHHPDTDDASRGQVQVMLELLPKAVAAKQPVGLGRAEPNAHPELPEPEGRHEMSMWSPMATMKSLLGAQLCESARGPGLRGEEPPAPDRPELCF